MGGRANERAVIEVALTFRPHWHGQDKAQVAAMDALASLCARLERIESEARRICQLGVPPASLDSLAAMLDEDVS